MNQREALADLLEAVEAAIEAGDWKVDGACDPESVIRRAKKAMAQKQEPVAWRFRSGTFFNREVHWRYIDTLEGAEGLLGLEPLYTSPPQRQPLTNEQIAKAWAQSKGDILIRLKPFARAIEAAHGIKGEV